MLSRSDKKWLKDIFATKGDLKGLAAKPDLNNLEKKLSKRFNKIDKKFIQLFNFLDKDVMNHERRIKNIESKMGISADIAN